MHESWKSFLKSEFEKPYFKELSSFLHESYDKTTVYPAKTQVFRAFSTDLNSVNVVILGQDPYHTPGAAHGLAFSVPKNQKIPPSLKNIYKEIDSEFKTNTKDLRSGDLSSWQKQGVMLLNNTLTVEAHLPGSHRGHGWERFTEEVIKYLDQNRPHLVFILWGRDARSKKNLINQEKHLVLESPHPSPFSANSGFFGCGHFKKCNEFLASHNLPEIDW